MAPRWPLVNMGPEHINEHATYLREVCNNLQAVDKGRANQIPWKIVQPYLASTLALISKVLQQPSLDQVLQQIQGTAKDIQTIQKDITVVKTSVGLSTVPLGTANFNGGRAAPATWAQVAARTTTTAPPPPPAQQGANASQTPITVTAYKDRSVTVKLKDHGIVQRYRTHPVAWTRRHVQTSIHNCPTTKTVKVVAAHQLKSGDIQIFTSTTAEAAQLKQNREWLRGLGERAEVIVPTHGVIVHGVLTKSINMKDQEATIQQILADNHTVVPDAKIAYVGWLTKEAALKRATSIVVEFADPEMANAIIYAGMAWEGQIHQCQLYDRACRMKQCFRCHHYSHIGALCNAAQTCGYCAELHETKNCRQKGVEGFTPRCAVCKGDHTAWSNACPARKKEMERVEQAKQMRSIYWHVPAKVNTTQPRTNDSISCENAPGTGHMEDSRSASNVIAQATTQEPSESTQIVTTQIEQQTQRTAAIENAPALVVATVETDRTHEVVVERTVGVQLGGEEWTGSGLEQEALQHLPDPPINPRLTQTDHAFPTLQPLGDYPPLPDHMMEVPGELEIQDDNAWLDSIFINNDDNWVPGQEQTLSSPLTSPPASLAEEPMTRAGNIFKACNCAVHQHIYDNWPTQDAELTIAKCMTVCMYCGVDYHRPPTLQQHLKGARHAQHNISVVLETRGRGSSITPSWTMKPRARTIHPQITRSRAATHSTNTAARQ